MRNAYVYDDGSLSDARFARVVFRIVEAERSDDAIGARARWLSVRPRRLRKDTSWVDRAAACAHRAGIALLVQDDADLALEIAWDGVELRPRGRSLSVARALLGAEHWLVARLAKGVLPRRQELDLADVVVCEEDAITPVVEWPARRIVAWNGTDRLEPGAAHAFSLGWLAASSAGTRPMTEDP